MDERTLTVDSLTSATETIMAVSEALTEHQPSSKEQAQATLEFQVVALYLTDLVRAMVGGADLDKAITTMIAGDTPIGDTNAPH